MLDMPFDISTKDESDSSAYIFYIPPTSHSEELIFYNEEARRIILAHEYNQLDEGKINLSEISSICATWCEQIDKEYLEKLDINHDLSKIPFYIGMMQSYRRKYAVKAVVLTKTTSKRQEKNYLFMLERFTPENLNLIKIIREYKLSNREQEILHLLIKGYSNKEIAYELNLSLNTIKTYMRLLMNKFNVTNRSSIIADLLKKGV